MNFSFNITIQDVIKMVGPLLAILCGFILGIVFEKRVIKNIQKLAAKTHWKYDTIIIDSIQGFSILWFSLGGVAVATNIYPIPPAIQLIINKFLIATFLASATLIVSRLLVGLLKAYTTNEQGISPLTSLFELLTKVVIYSLGVLIILQSIGIQITPLLTALGVGGVSLGLALQSPLTNLISGVSIVMSGKVQQGNYIRLASGESGYVVDVELKYTVLLEITDNLLVLPNSKILSGSFKNFSLPNKFFVLPVTLDVDYNSDLETVERITLEVANSLLENRVIEYESLEESNEEDLNKPFIRYNQFDYFSINLTIYLTIYEQEFFEHLEIKHQFLKELHKRYKAEGIEIPFPIQSGYLPPKKVDDTYAN